MRHITGIALATAIAGPAMAADLSVTAPPPVLVYNWTGIYGGVNGGGAWGQQDPFNILTNRFDHRFHKFQWRNGRRKAWRSNSHHSLGFELGRHQRFVGSHAINFRRSGRLHGQCNDQCQFGI